MVVRDGRLPKSKERETRVSKVYGFTKNQSRS